MHIPLLDELVKKGHDVTAVIPHYASKGQPKYIKEIVVHSKFQEVMSEN